MKFFSSYYGLSVSLFVWQGYNLIQNSKDTFEILEGIFSGTLNKIASVNIIICLFLGFFKLIVRLFFYRVKEFEQMVGVFLIFSQFWRNSRERLSKSYFYCCVFRRSLSMTLQIS